MKYFKGSSNKLGPLDFCGLRMWGSPSDRHNDAQPIHMRIKAALYPIWQDIPTPMKVTTNKLEKVLILS